MFDVCSLSPGRSRMMSPDLISNGMSQDDLDIETPLGSPIGSPKLHQMSVTSFNPGKIRKLKQPP